MSKRALLEVWGGFSQKDGVRYRLVIFDFDGTLADSFPLFLENLGTVSEGFGLRRLDAQSLEELRGCSAKEIMDRIGLPAWKVPLMVRSMRRLLAASAERTRLFPGVEAMLERLAESGCALSIVSSNSEANIRSILGPETAGRIGVYACGASLFGKASKFRRVLKKTGVRASEVLTIGDEIRDHEAAIEVGIDFAAVSWGYTRAEALEARSPAMAMRRIEDILSAILGTQATQ
jgi:phosphoglycolate phosphatase